jgi:RNA polymerase sigma-70 factor, ECF subfamily
MPATTLAPARPAASLPHGTPRGSGEMLAALYADHASDLRRFAARLTGDHGRAEDIVQETMLRAWRHAEKVGGRTGAPRAWLYTVARHLAIDQHRARRARPSEVELDHRLALTTSHHADAGIDETGVRAAIAALPWHQRRVLTEVYYRDQSVAETARILQIPVGTVKSRVHYGLQALRRILAAQDAVA